MYLKAVKPHLSTKSDADINAIMSYVENLKEEISFRIETIQKKIDLLQNIVAGSGGESQ